MGFSRFYRNNSHNKRRSTGLSPKFDDYRRWSHTYARGIILGSDAAMHAGLQTGPIGVLHVARPDGRQVLFSKDSVTGEWGTWDGDHLVLTALSGGGWELVNEKNDTEYFDATGQLTRIETKGGYAVSLVRSTDRIDITDSYGVSLALILNTQNMVTQLIDPNGGVTQYSYGEDGSIAAVLYPDGKTKKYTYEPASYRFLTSIEDERGLIGHTISYTSGGNKITETFNEGRGTFSFAPDATHSTTKNRVVDQLGKETVYTYKIINTQKKLVSIDSPASANCPQAATAYEYGNDGQLSAKIDWEGNRTEYERDALGRVTSKTVGTGTAVARTITTTWHDEWSKAVQRVEPGRTTDNTYDADGNLATRTVTDTATGLSRTWTFSHSGTGQLLSVDGPRSDVTDTTTFSYYNCTTGGQCGQRHTATNALGHVTTFNDYDAHGNVLRLTDANGVVTTMTYDLRQRLLTSTVAGATTSYTYDPVGNITRVTPSDGSYLAYEWDQANRLVAIEDALGNRMEWDLDAADNRTATRYKDASGTLKLNQQQVFDELSRLIKTVYAVSGEASYGYDKNGNRTSSVEPGGATTSSGYDALNRLVSSTDATGGVTGYGYDSQDNLTTVTDATGNTTAYSYNGFGDLLKLESPDTGTTVYTVDAAGNRLSETDVRGVTVSYQYDALNRLTSKSYADSSLNVSYSYDQGVNGIGRLSQVGDSTGSTVYSFDARGNITEQRSTIGGVLYSTGYSFDAANKLTGTTYPSGRSLAYGYDTAGRLSSITHVGGGSSETLISNLQYLPFGPLTGYTLGNGAVRTVEYDLDYRIGRIADGAILDRSYSYSAANSISGITDALAASNTQLFGYDDLNRLTSAAGAYGSHGYDYDAVGNRTQFSADAENQSYSYATGSNRLTDVGGTARSRDAAGNLTASGGNAFSYGEHNRLSGVTGLAGEVQYGHNALGQRVSKTANGTTRHYLFDRQGQLVGEANSDGSEPVEYAYLNGQPLAMWRSADGGGNGGGNTGNVLNAGEGDSGALGLKEWRHYTLSPSSNARTATVTMSGLTGDGDLYLKLGAQADDSTFDCKSDAGGTSTESCTLAVPENATLHIAMHGWAATDFSLSTSASDTGGGGGGSTTGGELAAGESASGSAGLKEWHHYTLTPAATARSVTATLNGLTADGDLYLRLGSQNDGSTFDCRSDNGGTSQESCTVDVAANETLHIGVHGWQATDYALSTTATDTGTGGGGGGGNTGGGTGGSTALSLDQAVSGSVAVQAYAHYTLAAGSSARALTVTVSGLTGDGDLYVRFGEQADNASFDCKSDNGGTSDEVCYVSQDVGAEMHIAVHGYAATDYTITVGGQ